MRIVTMWLIAFSLALSTVAHSEMESELRIGVVAPLTGSLQPYGEWFMHGAETAVREWRQQPDASTWKVTLIPADDQGLTEPVEALAQDLIVKHKVHALVGSLLSSINERLAVFTQRHKKLLLIPSPNDAPVLGLGQWTFNTALTSDQQAKALVAFITQQLRLRQGAILYDQTQPYYQKQAQLFQRLFQTAGAQTLISTAYDPQSKDFAAILDNIAQREPQFVIHVGQWYDGARLMTQAKNMNLKLLMIGGELWDNPQLLQITPEAVIRGQYFLSQYSPLDPAESGQNFARRYRSDWDSAPNAVAAYGYQAVNILLQAYQQAHATLPDALQKPFRSGGTFNGLTGPARFLSNGNIHKAASILLTTPPQGQFMTRAEP